jgi:hypothetical protein
MFAWLSSGAPVISRGPAWTNATTRSLALTRVGGFLVNSLAITNGPAAGYGLYVGTIATDPSAATVSFNPWPLAASGGPSGGAWVGLWNQFNRVNIISAVQDSKNTWTYGSTTWRQADNSANNQITFVAGQPDDNQWFKYVVGSSASSSSGAAAIGFDSTTTPVGVAGLSDSPYDTLVAFARANGQVGQHFAAALEAAGAGTNTFYGGELPGATITAQAMQLSAELRY